MSMIHYSFNQFKFEIQDPPSTAQAARRNGVSHQARHGASLGYVAADQIVRPAPHDKPSPGRGIAVLMG